MSAMILASRSPARARLLAAAGIKVLIEPSGVDEDALKAAAIAGGRPPRAVATELAEAKGLAVSQGREALVIAADQTLDLDGRLLDKPVDLAAARDQLHALRGREHRLHSAATVCRRGVVVWQAVETVSLRMRRFSDAFLHAYLEAEGDHLLGCVGAYRLEAMGVQLFEAIEGDYFAVLGLPLLPLLTFLRAEGEVAA